MFIAAHSLKKNSGHDADARLNWNNRSVGYCRLHWCGHVLRMEDGDLLRMALDFSVEGQRNYGRLEGA